MSIKLFRESNPPVCLLFQLADSEVLPTACQTSLSLRANITKCRPACLHACVFPRVCVFQTERPLVYPSTRLLAPLFIICLSSFVLSFLSVACLSSPPGFPNVKWQQRGRQRGWRTFLMEGFYILTSLPSLFLHLAQWGRKMRRQTEEKNINKLHINWSAAGLAQTVTQPRPLTHCPRL